MFYVLVLVAALACTVFGPPLAGGSDPPPGGLGDVTTGGPLH